VAEPEAAGWQPYAWAPIRVAPRVERDERLNAGVVLYSRPLRFLGARTVFDPARLAMLDPTLDLHAVARHLRYLERVAAGDPEAGPIARLPQPERFGWLTAPASTVVQPGPVHAGLCRDPAAELDHLFRRMVGVEGVGKSGIREVGE
jgi:DUF3037 family protein